MITAYLAAAALALTATSQIQPVHPFPRRALAVRAAAQPPSEFVRPMGIAALGRKVTRKDIDATADEFAALAARFDLESLGSLSANVSLSVVDKRRMRVRAKGTMSASDVVVRGVMGSTPSILQVDGVPFETFFAEDEEGGGTFDSDEDYSYDEPIDNGQVDLGELVAQHLYLHLSFAEQARNREFETDSAAGTIVFDTDADADS